MMTYSKVSAAVVAVSMSLAIHTAPADEPKFDIVVKRLDDKVEATTKERATTFSVRSPFGIGSAIIKRVEANWPERVKLKLHLKGLEGLKISNGKKELAAEVFGVDNKRYLQWSSDRKGQELTEPPGNEIGTFSSDGKPSKTTPLEAGYFEVLLPKELFEDNAESIRIVWIDFYR